MKVKLKNVVEFEEMLIRKGLSKKAFAEAAGIGQVTALQICNGERHPSPRLSKQITDALKVQFDDVFVIVHESKLNKQPQVAVQGG